MSSSTSRTIREAITGLYPSITLPHSLGTITALEQEPDGEFSALPAVVVFRQPTQAIERKSSGVYAITRPFIARLYIAKLSNDNPLPSVEESILEQVEDCAEVVEDYFNLTDQRLGGTAHVLDAWVSNDTGATKMPLAQNGKNTNLYAGIAFWHTVKYSRWR